MHVSKYFTAHKGIKKIMLILHGEERGTPVVLPINHEQKLDHKSSR
jgi:hypothetical protein